MEYKEFRRQLGKSGLTNKAFAGLVKINCNSITNYKKAGDVPTHWAIVAVLIAELSENKIDFRSVLGKMKIEPNKVRGAAAKGRFGGSRQTDLPV